MQLHELKRNNQNKKAKRIGRGGKRGKTSGRGHKGQKARTGNSTRTEMRDIIKRLPKRRGYGKNRSRTVNADKVRAVAVNLATIETHFKAGETVSPKTLLAYKLVRRQKGNLPLVKVLGHGDITKAVIVRDCLISSTAASAIEKAGGTVHTT